MKTDHCHYAKLLWMLALGLACRAGFESAFAEDTANKDTAKPAASVSHVKFRPPADGAPSVRVTGGSRGSGDSTLTLDVLAPNETGITTLEQPSLFWFQSKPANAKFELTLLQENKAKPLVQFTVERSSKAGIQRLKLA